MKRWMRMARVVVTPGVESLEGRALLTAHGLARGPEAVAQPVAIVAPTTLPLDPTAPEVARAQLVSVGKVVTGVSVTFTRPMAPGPVANVHDYFLIDGTRKVSPSHLQASLIPLKAASYNPATFTVTLTPAAKLKPSGSYIITNVDIANPLQTAADVQRFAATESALVDVDGQLLGDRGAGPGVFSFVVSRAHPTGQSL